MCGIIAIHSRPSTRAVPSADEVLTGLDAALAAAPDIAAVAVRAHHVDQLLRGVAGVQCMIGRRELVTSMTSRLDQLDAVIATAEADLELNPALTADAVEQANATLVGLRDAVWAIRNDRLRAARAVDDLAGRDAGDAAIAGYFAVQQALSALDRLEVRGRDSAGVHLYVWNHGLTLDDPAVQALLGERQDNPLFLNGSVRFAGACISFVYKAAVEIGELGDNTRNLRKSMAADSLLRLALSAPTARLALLGHTRWASVGIISEANCHPLNSEEVESSYDSGPYVVGALNGDVDNHADLKVEYNLRIAGPITTDAKVIPAMVSRLSGVSAGDLT
ncbi:MAG: glmS [Ilumatobacteraceae bacterium]|nr:glmS [Ilumatobacteraceae bacterium]